MLNYCPCAEGVWKCTISLARHIKIPYSLSGAQGFVHFIIKLKSSVVRLQRADFPQNPEVFDNKQVLAFFESTCHPHSKSAGSPLLPGLAFSKWPPISKMAAVMAVKTTIPISQAIVNGFGWFWWPFRGVLSFWVDSTQFCYSIIQDGRQISRWPPPVAVKTIDSTALAIMHGFWWSWCHFSC